jgi:hypothetical protein
MASYDDRKRDALLAASELLSGDSVLNALARNQFKRDLENLNSDEISEFLPELARLTRQLRDELLNEPSAPYDGLTAAPRRG